MAVPRHARLLERLLAKLVGEMHIYVTLNERKAAEIRVEGKRITIDIKNPLVAAELGVEQWLLSRGKPPSRTLARLKEQGYTILVKYKALKAEL